MADTARKLNSTSSATKTQRLHWYAMISAAYRRARKQLEHSCFGCRRVSRPGESEGAENADT